MEDPEVVGDIYLPHVYVYYHKFRVYFWYEAVFFPNPRTGVILMRYWMTVQVRIMRSSVMCKNKLIIGDMTLKRILIVPC